MLSKSKEEFPMKVVSFFFLIVFLASLTGCYRAPGEFDYCTIPTTNNPSITKEKTSGPIPNMKY